MVARLARCSTDAAVVTAEAAAGNRRVIHVGIFEAVGSVANVTLGCGHQVAARFHRSTSGATNMTAGTAAQDIQVIHADVAAKVGSAVVTVLTGVGGGDMAAWFDRCATDTAVVTAEAAAGNR